MTSFSQRHIGLTAAEASRMLDTLGYPSTDALLAKAVPESIQLDGGLTLPGPFSEAEATARIRSLADQNVVLESLIGAGWNDTITPPVILRNMIENPAWYTSYTPYQPEISQGRLEMLLVFQTMIADLTGCELANASMLDEATAAAEAMTLLRRVTKSKLDTFFVDSECHPSTIDVVTTRAEPLGIKLIIGDPNTDLVASEVYGALLAQTGTTGRLLDLASIIDDCHAANCAVGVTTDLLACCLLTPPGDLGADVVVGSAQRFGVPMGFGGPHAGFMAAHNAHARSLPGRLVGVSVDANGDPALRLALQTREQHIRREKATSNICTAQALLANVAAAYACWHGPDGLTALAGRINGYAATLAASATAAGLSVNDSFFDTVTVTVPGRSDEIVAAAVTRGINLRRVDADRVGVSFDEVSTLATVDAVLESFGLTTVAATNSSIPSALARRSEFLTDGRFHSFRSETDMMRWLRRLADRDLALDRTMIPLGSCTMKLNAAAEMDPITWPEFASMHPLAPADQAAGYLRLIADLEAALCEITGYDAVSLQPNAGSQGEYAGLLAIAAYHRSRGEDQRDVCLIPASAHGTNAASAVLAGMRVSVVACTDSGDVDLVDLQAKLDQHGDQVAAIMITYPSTHGVYEQDVRRICNLVHEAGGQVYTDGANLNAIVGFAKPGEFGSDVSHLNLHKTFCIPHGGGGPGVGPIGVRSHLAPFLPGAGSGPVSGAPFGSAGILPITWMYIQMMGPDGLRAATAAAVLSANYLAHKLRDHFPILYAGPAGLVAHECIVDIRPITAATDVTVDDIAKRLADCGFHAPTMSFPVPGTLMIEPTESESLQELDRFIDAMVMIRNEIAQIEAGEVAVEDSALRHAPHTAAALMAETWDRPYSRTTAAFPLPGMDRDKYFPPVGRVDNAYGDRNLSCSCPPLDAYGEL
ncbi:MAG: aminomethyl-transferring glycine dehydrogenase [Acidimicrobiales bacterium]